MSWVHEMRRAAVADCLEIHALRQLPAGPSPVRNAYALRDSLSVATRNAMAMLDMGHTAHRAIERGKQIIDGGAYGRERS